MPKLNFPGFENSFMQSTPLKSPTSARTRRPSGLGADTTFEGTPRRQSQAGPSRQKDDIFSPSKRSPSKRDAPIGRLPPKDDFIQDFDMDIPHSTPQRIRRASSPAMDFGDMSSVMGSDINEMAVDSEKGDLDDDNYEGLDFREEVCASPSFHTLINFLSVPPCAFKPRFAIIKSYNVSSALIRTHFGGCRYQLKIPIMLFGRPASLGRQIQIWIVGGPNDHCSNRNGKHGRIAIQLQHRELQEVYSSRIFIPSIALTSAIPNGIAPHHCCVYTDFQHVVTCRT